MTDKTMGRDEAVRVLEARRKVIQFHHTKESREEIAALGLAIAALRDGEGYSYCLNLLAAIHRDGGHYTDKHGVKKSTDDAIAKWYEAAHDAAFPAQQPEAQAVAEPPWITELRAEAMQGAMKDVYWLSRDQVFALIGTHPTTPAVGGDSFGGMKVVRDPNVPEGQVHAVQVGKVVGIVTPAVEPSSEGVERERIVGIFRDFIFDADKQHHTPILKVHFEPVPVGSGFDAPGWIARDRLHIALATKPAKGGEG